MQGGKRDTCSSSRDAAANTRRGLRQQKDARVTRRGMGCLALPASVNLQTCASSLASLERHLSSRRQRGPSDEDARCSRDGGKPPRLMVI